MTDKQIIEKIEEIIAPYQTEIELDCLSLPIAIESILERKEQECKELKKENYELKEEVSIDRALFAEISKLRVENDELKQRIKEQAKELWDKTTQIRVLKNYKDNSVCESWDLDMLGY